MVLCIDCICCKVINSPTEKKQWFLCQYSPEETYEAFSPDVEITCPHFYDKPQDFDNKLDDMSLIVIGFSHKPSFAKRVE